MSHAAKAADELLIKPAACPAGTACSLRQIPKKDTQAEVGQVLSHKQTDRRQPHRHTRRRSHSPSQVLQSRILTEMLQWESTGARPAAGAGRAYVVGLCRRLDD